MARHPKNEIRFAHPLAELIADNPTRSFALAVLSGFAAGGGLGARAIFRLMLVITEAAIGNQIIPGLFLMAESNEHRSSDKR